MHSVQDFQDLYSSPILYQLTFYDFAVLENEKEQDIYYDRTTKKFGWIRAYDCLPKNANNSILKIAEKIKAVIEKHVYNQNGRTMVFFHAETLRILLNVEYINAKGEKYNKEMEKQSVLGRLATSWFYAIELDKLMTMFFTKEQTDTISQWGIDDIRMLLNIFSSESSFRAGIHYHDSWTITNCFSYFVSEVLHAGFTRLVMQKECREEDKLHWLCAVSIWNKRLTGEHELKFPSGIWLSGMEVLEKFHHYLVEEPGLELFIECQVSHLITNKTKIPAVHLNILNVISKIYIKKANFDFQLASDRLFSSCNFSSVGKRIRFKDFFQGMQPCDPFAELQLVEQAVKQAIRPTSPADDNVAPLILDYCMDNAFLVLGHWTILKYCPKASAYCQEESAKEQPEADSVWTGEEPDEIFNLAELVGDIERSIAHFNKKSKSSFPLSLFS